MDYNVMTMTIMVFIPSGCSLTKQDGRYDQSQMRAERARHVPTARATSTCSHDVWNSDLGLVGTRFQGSTMFHRRAADGGPNGSTWLGGPKLTGLAGLARATACPSGGGVTCRDDTWQRYWCRRGVCRERRVRLCALHRNGVTALFQILSGACQRAFSSW
jgi:hypothetical protein